MNKLPLLAVLVATSISANAASSNPFKMPKKHFNKTKIALVSTDLTLRILDAYSTERALENPRNHEQTLPNFIVKSPTMMYSYSIGVVGVYSFISTELERHGHSKLSLAPYIVDIGVEAPTLHNFTLPKVELEKSKKF